MLDRNIVQANAIEAIRAGWARGKRRQLLVAPTAFGKTHTTANIMKQESMFKNRVMFVVHRRELLAQTSKRLTSMGLHHGVIMAGIPAAPDERLQLATVQTFQRRFMGKDMPFDLVIFDEAHRDEYSKVAAKYSSSRLLGLTATPVRREKTLHGEYDEMVVAVTYPVAIEAGFILPPIIYAPSRPDMGKVKIKQGDFDQVRAGEIMSQANIVGDVVKHWKKLASNRKTLVFATTIAHAMKLTHEFRKNDILAACISSETPESERRETLQNYERGILRVLCNVGIFIEGYDDPETSCIVMARPTRSIALFMQACGRGARTHPGKSDYLLLDHASNVFTHGSPAQHRPWNLDPPEERDPGTKPAAPAAPPITYCSMCFCCYASKEPKCPQCGHARMMDAVMTAVDGELKLVEKLPEIGQHTSEFEIQRRKLFVVARHKRLTGAAMWKYINTELTRQRAIQWGRQQVFVPAVKELLW